MRRTGRERARATPPFPQPYDYGRRGPVSARRTGTGRREARRLRTKSAYARISRLSNREYAALSACCLFASVASRLIRSATVLLYRDSCPLCHHVSDIRVAEADGFGVRCRTCGSFVIDDQLTQVIANARSRGLRNVLEHLPRLSVAARYAHACGQPLTITSTNWVRIARTAQPLD